MIVAAGLTPAWQQILSFDTLAVGKVNRASDSHWCASGKVLNVGRAVHSLGADSLTVSVVGGLPGDAIAAEFDGDGIPCEWLRTENPTRVCTTIRDHRDTTELVENARAMETDMVRSFITRVIDVCQSADLLVLSGSLPADCPTDVYQRITSVVPCRVLIDARGPELLAALNAHPWLVKPNRDELKQTLNWMIAPTAAIDGGAGHLQHLGAGHVVITDGTQDVRLQTADIMHRLATIQVPAVNPIGCGDALAAGIAVATVEGAEIVEAVRFGIAAAANNAEQLLPARLDRQRIDELLR